MRSFSFLRASLLLVVAMLAGPIAGAQTFSNNTTCFISSGPPTGAPGCYSSNITVSGVPTIYNISVTLNGCDHTYAADLDILLVGPDGQTVMLMSDCGGPGDLVNTTLTFRDSGPLMPQNANIPSGAYRPTNYDLNDVLQPPAPPAPHGTQLDTWVGASADGTWRLWVYDDADADGGDINGWSISFNTALPSTPIRTGFTYQGLLRDASGTPLNSTVDMRFSLWSHPSTPIEANRIGSVLQVSALPVVNGDVQVSLDFGTNIYSGAAKWLQVEVADAGSGNFDVLSPRQPITISPAAGTAFRLVDPVFPDEPGVFSTGLGFVSIGDYVQPSSNIKLVVGGNAGKPGGGSWAVLSDRRLKHDIAPLSSSLDRLLQLRGVSFLYTPDVASRERPGRRVGFVAQEVEPIFPDWVDTGPDGIKTVTFRGFEAITVEALRDLRAESDAAVNAAHAEIEALRQQVAARDERLQALERRLAELEARLKPQTGAEQP
ncbi:MAG: tail fiber domain-containing protein [Planctomycetota bacterium]|nr:tail fiber domain-containing protein [Planctomycetota bacterium]